MKAKSKLTKQFCSLLFCIISLYSFSTPNKKVYFIPTLHGIHQANKSYSYDSLKQLVNHLNPDVIAVEIRQEDINGDSLYLSKNYPYEMRMMKYWLPNAKIVGFDWLGDDIEGKPIPNNYWKDISSIKKSERELQADSLYATKCAACDTFRNQRIGILKDNSLKEILKSKDAQFARQFYDCLADQLNGTKHEDILKFYDKRNEKILINIKKVIKNNKNKTIVIITGDDHYIYLQDSFHHDLIYKN
ncbi:MAG: hypothetical protein ACM3MI_11560 [Clostridiales bacterium]